MIARIIACAFVVGISGCGNWFVDSSYVDDAEARAKNPNLTRAQRGRIFENAGDTALARGRRGFTDDMYFNAALAYDTGPTPEGDADVRRIYDKCIQARIQSAPGCSEVAALMDEWSRMRPGAPGGQGAAGRQGAPQSAGGASYILPGQSRAGGSSQPATEPTPPEMDIDEAIRKAKAKLAGRPGTIDGCPTNIRHLESELPVCSNNEDLIKLRELILATDASFVDDQAAGYSLRQVATLAAQAARQHEETLKSAERAMFETSAHEGMARRRLDALRQMPPVCDAGPRGSFGMTENAYQIYVNAFMTSKANRAVSAVAACRARAAPR